LEPLSESETIDYIRHRLIHAGWTGDPGITKGAYCLIYHFSGGIPVIINRICHRFLLYGCAEKKHELNADDMKSVLEVLHEKQLVSTNTSEFSDLEEKINILENESIQSLERIKKTSGSAEDSGVFHNPASCWRESSDNASAENNSCGDARDSNDESQIHIEATASEVSGSPGERSRWSWNYAWLAVPAAIVIAAGLKIYSGTQQDHTQIQSQADIVSPPPVHQIQLAENIQLDATPAVAADTRHTDPSKDKLEAATGTSKKSAIAAVKPVESVETTRATASGETVLPPGKEPAAIDRPRAAPVRQAAKPLAQPLPKVQETTETLTLTKADRVIIQPEKRH